MRRLRPDPNQTNGVEMNEYQFKNFLDARKLIKGFVVFLLISFVGFWFLTLTPYRNSELLYSIGYYPKINPGEVWVFDTEPGHYKQTNTVIGVTNAIVWFTVTCNHQTIIAQRHEFFFPFGNIRIK